MRFSYSQLNQLTSYYILQNKIYKNYKNITQIKENHTQQFQPTASFLEYLIILKSKKVNKFYFVINNKRVKRLLLLNFKQLREKKTNWLKTIKNYKLLIAAEIETATEMAGIA